MTPTIIEFPGRKFVGQKVSLRETKAAANNMTVVPGLWQKVVPVGGTLENRVGQERYALITGDLPEDRKDQVDYYALFAVSDFSEVPEGFERYEIPAGRAVKAVHKGPPQTLGKTVSEVFFNWLPRSGECISLNLELFAYPEGYDRNDPEGTFDYYLFLK